MRSITIYLLFILPLITFAQSKVILSGPMLGHVELRTAKIWAEVISGSTINLWYWKKGEIGKSKSIQRITGKNDWFSTVTFDQVGLDINTTYEYQMQWTTGQPTKADGEFSTWDLWQYRKPAPDFTFLSGSCAYFNERVYDRPGAPYGKDSSIFDAMSKEKASFMLWLGDNWYLREVDYFSEWGIWYRAHRDRSHQVLQPFLKAMPHYAIWDDHDYGPNNADKSFHLKETSRKVFMNYWANPSYGENGEGIYTKVNYADVDFFLMDDRYFRSSDDMQPEVDGKPNPEKRMWGAKQMEWLKNALRNSRAVFKLIVTGSQTLNTISTADNLQDYPVEFQEFLSFINSEKMGGIIFLTGDRHHSEVIRYDRPGMYPLYDITTSPLTAGIAKVGGKDKDNPSRIPGTLVEEHNYARITISGKQGERMLTVQYAGIMGQTLAQWNVAEKDLRVNK